MLPTTFEFVLTLIAPKLNRTKPGYKPVSPNKQFLIAIWNMATPDSYRYFWYTYLRGRNSNNIQALKHVLAFPMVLCF